MVMNLLDGLLLEARVDRILHKLIETDSHLRRASGRSLVDIRRHSNIEGSLERRIRLHSEFTAFRGGCTT